MMTGVELDRVLKSWMSEGAERVPPSDLQAVLAIVATTEQRRRRPWNVGVETSRPRTSTLLIAATLLLVIAGAIGVGAGVIRLDPPAPAPERNLSPEPLRLVGVPDWPVRLSVPTGWSEIPVPCCDYRQFAGTSPEGTVSVGHESPYRTAVCDPECHDIDLPLTIPYDASALIESLKSQVEAIAGAAGWTDPPAALRAQVVDGARLDAVGSDDGGRRWRTVYVVGLVARNVVAIAFSQPDDQFDPDLADTVLAGITLGEAPQYSDGDLMSRGHPEFTMSLPGFWITPDQPVLDGTQLSGVYRFGEGEVVVSIGREDGTLGWCDPACRVLTGQLTLDVLERSTREGRALGQAVPTLLGGELALFFGTNAPSLRRYVVAMHEGRPVALMIDTGEWDVAPGIVDEMISSFRFVEVVPAPVERVFITAGGRVQLALSSHWEVSPARPDLFFFVNSGLETMTVRAGTDDGAIATCEEPAAPWELCRQILAITVEELVAAVQPAPIDDHGVGPPVGRRFDMTLGGEPAVMTRIQAYEYPARSGQEVVYIAAFHDGRPYLVRLWTSANEVRDLDSVISGFEFVD